MEFTSWDAGLHTNDPNSLELSGIKGMHWGVRRYQNEDGSLTPAGRERYGVESTKRTSARRMEKDFNRLDKGYANVVANQRYNAQRTAKYAKKAHKAQRKGREEKARRLIEKSLKYAKKAALNNEQRKAVEKLQWKIIGKAATKGYTVNSTPVKRFGVDDRGRGLMAAGSQFGLDGGLLGTGAAYKKHSVTVDGQQVKISKRGDGKTNIVNYANANKFAEEERRRERAKQLSGVKR